MKCAAPDCSRRVHGLGFYFCTDHTASRMGGARRARGAARDVKDNVSGRLPRASVSPVATGTGRVPSARPGGPTPAVDAPESYSELELAWLHGDH